MTKADIIEQVSKRTGFTKVETEIVFGSILDAIKKALQSGNRVDIRGFANFSVRRLPGREARNPKTNEKVWVKERFHPICKISKLLTESVNNSQLKGF